MTAEPVSPGSWRQLSEEPPRLTPAAPTSARAAAPEGGRVYTPSSAMLLGGRGNASSTTPPRRNSGASSSSREMWEGYDESRDAEMGSNPRAENEGLTNWHRQGQGEQDGAAGGGRLRQLGAGMARVLMRVFPMASRLPLGGGSSASSTGQTRAAEGGNSPSDFDEGPELSLSATKPRGYHVVKAERERRQLCKDRFFKVLAVLACLVLICCLVVWQQFTRHLLLRLPLMPFMASITDTSARVPSEADKANCDPANKFPVFVDAFGNLVKQTDEVRRATLDNARDQGRWANDHKLEDEKHQQVMVGLEIIVDVLDKAEIGFFAVGQTALGSYLFHGSSPWATTIDLSIDLGDAHRLYDAVKAYNESPIIPTIYARDFIALLQDTSKAPRLHYYMSDNVGFLWFSNSSSETIFDQSIRRPQARIHWFVETLEVKPGHPGDADPDVPYAFLTFSEMRSDGHTVKKVKMEKSHVLPAAKRPFGLLNLPFPHALLRYLNDRFNTVEPYCPGKMGVNILPEVEESDSCTEMYKVYYHVDRQVITPNCVKEVLYYASEPTGVVYSQGDFEPAPWAKTWGEAIRGRKAHLIAHDVNYD